jgi:signal transduction histidine kinase
MQQVFVNLVANAIRYTEPPGRIWISATQEGPEVVVRITDEGEGIAPDKLNSLFEVFTLPNSHGSKLGLGLGLMQVKKIVDAHGGAVQVKSEGPGQGSQFTVRFPARNEPGPMGI